MWCIKGRGNQFCTSTLGQSKEVCHGIPITCDKGWRRKRWDDLRWMHRNIANMPIDITCNLFWWLITIFYMSFGCEFLLYGSWHQFSLVQNDEFHTNFHHHSWLKGFKGESNQVCQERWKSFPTKHEIHVGHVFLFKQKKYQCTMFEVPLLYMELSFRFTFLKIRLEVA